MSLGMEEWVQSMKCVSFHESEELFLSSDKCNAQQIKQAEDINKIIRHLSTFWRILHHDEQKQGTRG